MTEQFIAPAVVDAMDELIGFLVEDRIEERQAPPGYHTTDITTWDRLAAAVVAAVNADYTRKPGPNVVNPTMTRDELVAAAESIGMRFPFPVPTPREPVGLLAVSALGGRYRP